MPQYRVTSPDGRVFDVTAPEGATQQDAIAYVQSGAAKPPQATPEPDTTPQPQEQASLPARLMQSVTDFGKSAFHGMTGSFGDEITGAALAPVLAAANAVKGEPFDLKRDYESARGIYNRQLEDYRERHPIASTAAEIGGGVATAAYAPGLRAMSAPANATMAARTLGNVKQGATVGAIYGAGEGEGVVDRISGAATGASIGGITGAAATPAVDGISKVLQHVANMTVNRAGTNAQTTVAARKAAEALLRDGLTPEQAAAKITQMGPEAALMDVGVNTRRLAGSVSRLPGAASSSLDDFVRVRQEGARGADGVLRGGQTERIGRGIDDMVSGGFTADDRAAVAAQRTAAAKPLYGNTSNDMTKLVPEDQLAGVLDDPYIAGVIKNVQADDLTGMASAPRNSLAVLDAAIKDIDDQVGAAQRAGQGNRARLLMQRLDAVRTAATDAFPEYGQARQVWHEFSGVMDAGDLGRKFMTGNQAGRPDELAAAVRRMGNAELEQLRRGAAQAIYDKLGGLNSRSDATKKLYNIPALEAKTRAVFGDNATFQRYVGMLDDEAQMFKSYAEITGGSPTAQRAAADLDTNMDPGAVAEGMVGIASNPLDIAAWLRTGSRLAGDAANRVRMPEAQRGKLAEILAGQDVAPLHQRLLAEQASATSRGRLAEQLARGGAVTTAPR